MRLVAAFIKLIRLPNLFFIALTQALFQICIIRPIFNHAELISPFSGVYLFLLILSSVFIAAAGYIINDYFDINIDQVNKPQENVVDRVISRRWAMLWHSLFSFSGVALGFFLGWKLDIFWLGLVNFFCSVLLFVYSTTFKKRLISGNFIIAILTAWSVAVIGLSTFYISYISPDSMLIEKNKLLRITLLYTSFAFILSLIREAIKDLEDLLGDMKYGCRTMPIIWGINATRIYTAIWLFVLVASLVISTFYLSLFKWWTAVAYTFILIIGPSVLILKDLFRANTPDQFHKLSNYSKLVMLTGILSMIFFYFYL